MLKISLCYAFIAFFFSPSIQPLLLLSFSSLYYLCLSPLSFLTVAVNWLSHVLQVWLYPNPGGNCWENISGYHRLSGYAPYQFLQLALLKSWMKNDNTPSLTQRKQVGESCSLAIRNLTKALGAGAGVRLVFLLLLSVIKSFNQASTLWRKSELRPKWQSCYGLNRPGANIIRVYYVLVMCQASLSAAGHTSKLGMTLRRFTTKCPGALSPKLKM